MGIVRIFAPYESWPGPVSETGAAPNVTEHEATLEGEIEPAEKGLDGFAYFFEYGASASYGASAPAPPGGTIGPSASCGLICEGLESFPKRVRVDLAGLEEPGTTYHRRLVSTNVNEGYRSFGEDATFTTGGEKPPPSSGGSETPSTTGGDGQLGASEHTVFLDVWCDVPCLSARRDNRAQGADEGAEAREGAEAVQARAQAQASGVWARCQEEEAGYDGERHGCEGQPA